MVVDLRDWTYPIVFVTGAVLPGTDFPDWVQAVSIPSDAGGGLYPTHTGTTTPEGNVTGTTGDTYEQTTTGMVWQKATGTATTTGWVFQAESGDGTAAFTLGNLTGPEAGGANLSGQSGVSITDQAPAAGSGGIGILSQHWGVSISSNSPGRAVSLAAGSGGPQATILVNGSGVNISSNSNPLGFFGVTAVSRPTVTGSRGGNAALASLLTALNSLGLILDSSTP